uniref:Uncharacterized protein n=1 Tax=Glossina pallidipes TaxID=7398 RepID=A0A1A9ZA98_GLOPL
MKVRNFERRGAPLSPPFSKASWESLRSCRDTVVFDIIKPSTLQDFLLITATISLISCFVKSGANFSRIAPIDVAVAKVVKPIGPQPKINTSDPKPTLARRQLAIPTAKGSSRAPSSMASYLTLLSSLFVSLSYITFTLLTMLRYLVYFPYFALRYYTSSTLLYLAAKIEEKAIFKSTEKETFLSTCVWRRKIDNFSNKNQVRASSTNFCYWEVPNNGK